MHTVKLTEAEVAEKAQAMAQTGKRLFELDEMEEGVKAEYKERIAEIKKERLAVALQFKRLSRAVTLGVEERDGQQSLFRDADSITFSSVDSNGEVKETITCTPEQLSKAAEKIAAQNSAILCKECDTINGHKATCSQYETASGTPVETRRLPHELDEWAKKVTDVTVMEKVKRVEVDGNPYVVVKQNGTPHRLVDKVEAFPVLPISITGDHPRQRQFNCGTKKKPDIWAASGERVTFTIRQTETKED